MDDYTVRIECDRPKADLLTGANSIPILPEHVWSAISPKAAATSYANKPPIVGSGPFQCVEFKNGGYMKMVANKAYWRGAPKVDEVLFEYYTNRDSMAGTSRPGPSTPAISLATNRSRSSSRRPASPPERLWSTATTTWS